MENVSDNLKKAQRKKKTNHRHKPIIQAESYMNWAEVLYELKNNFARHDALLYRDITTTKFSSDTLVRTSSAFAFQLYGVLHFYF